MRIRSGPPAPGREADAATLAHAEVARDDRVLAPTLCMCVRGWEGAWRRVGVHASDIDRTYISHACRQLQAPAGEGGWPAASLQRGALSCVDTCHGSHAHGTNKCYEKACLGA